MDGFTDFLAWSVRPANFGYTLLLALMFLYWISVVAGALDISFGTPDVGDADADVDVKVHGSLIDAQLDADVHAPQKGFAKAVASKGLVILKFFNIGEVPLMLYLSVFIPVAWGLSMTVTHIAGWDGWIIGILLFVPVVMAAAFAAKIATLPLKSLFRALNRPGRLANPLDLVGRECVIVSLTADAAHGQAEIPTDGVTLPLNVVTRAGVKLAKGSRAVVVELADEERSIYRIEPV